MARGWRVTETYIRCICDSITMGNNLVNVFKYHPVIGSGYIELNGNEEWGEYVIPIEYDRFKTKVELLKDLGYSVMFIAQKLGTTEDEVRKIVGKDYVHKDYSEMRNEYFMLLNENRQLRDEISELKRQYEMLQGKHDAVAGVNDCLNEENAKLKTALESEMADNLQFEQRGKELTEKNDILTKQLDKAEDEINELKERYRTLQAQCVGVCNEDSEKLTEENANLTKQIADLRSAYDRIYTSRDEYIKRVEELTAEIEDMRTVIKSLSKYKDSWEEKAAQCAKELEAANAKYDEAMREVNCLRTAVSTWRATAFDYKKKYGVAKSANDSISNRCDNLAAENERLIIRNGLLRTHRNRAIKLLYVTHTIGVIGNALDIPDALIKEIIEEETT